MVCLVPGRTPEHVALKILLASIAPSSANGGPGGRRWGGLQVKVVARAKKTGLGRIPRHSSFRATCFKRNKERGGGDEEQTDKVWIKV